MDRIGLVVVLVVFFGVEAFAQTVVGGGQKISARVPADGDAFGVGLDANENYLLVGAPGVRAEEEPFVAVHLYRRLPGGGVELLREIQGQQDSLDRRFGISVSLGSDFFAVASANHFHTNDNPRAVVHVYDRDYPSADSWGLRSVVQVTDDSLFSAIS